MFALTNPANFHFSRDRGRQSGTYFIVARNRRVREGMRFCLGAKLLDLRRKWAGNASTVQGFFHLMQPRMRKPFATTVFDFILKQDFEVQATIMEKSKAQEHIRSI